MPVKPRHVAPVAFSYVRFSDPAQGHGDSIRRQEAARDAWCQRNGVKLDTSLTLRDEGVSGFSGRHRSNPDRFALAAFLRLVEQGRIPRGSYIIVESLDRLTREHIRPALTLLLNLIEAGIRVVQLIPVEQVFDESIEPMTLMMAIMELSRGHSESRVKSERLGPHWEQRRSDVRDRKRRLMTRAVPKWVEVDGERMTVPATHAATIRRIFKLARDGNGVYAICRRLNAEGIPTFGRSPTWIDSVVYRLLTDPAVIGTYQPATRHKQNGRRVPAGDPIANYYPRVIPDSLYYAVQAAIARRANFRGKRGRHVNLFAGLLVDARDGGRISYTHEAGKWSRLFPVNAKLGLPNSVWCTFPSDVFERCVLALLAEVDSKEVERGDDEDDGVTALADQLADIEGKLEGLTERLVSGSAPEVIERAARRLEAEREAVAADLEVARQRSAVSAAQAWTEFGALVELAGKGDDHRLKLQAVLRRLIESVWCLFGVDGQKRVAVAQVYFADSIPPRIYVLSHSPLNTLPNGKSVDPSTSARSYSEKIAGRVIDLRDPAHVARLCRTVVKVKPMPGRGRGKGPGAG